MRSNKSRKRTSQKRTPKNRASKMSRRNKRRQAGGNIIKEIEKVPYVGDIIKIARKLSPNAGKVLDNYPKHVDGAFNRKTGIFSKQFWAPSHKITPQVAMELKRNGLRYHYGKDWEKKFLYWRDPNFPFAKYIKAKRK